MREKQKDAERAALGQFVLALKARGIAPIHAPQVKDAPDGLFLIEGNAVAVECRYVAHPQLLAFLGKRQMPSDKPYEILLPREPHLWVQHAIEAKSKNVPKYLERTGATETWLLLHSSHYQRILADKDLEGSDTLELLRAGAGELACCVASRYGSAAHRAP